MRLSSMADRAAVFGRPDAAQAIALDLLGLAGVANPERRVAPSPARDGSIEPNSSPVSSPVSLLGEVV